VREDLDLYAEDRADFPDQSILPWSNMTAYDSWTEDTFFAVVIIYENTVELFCGTGWWPDVRNFAEGDSEYVPAAELHREWSARFAVPYEPVVTSRAVVREWLGREW
jgi:hypothetical protein